LLIGSEKVLKYDLDMALKDNAYLFARLELIEGEIGSEPEDMPSDAPADAIN